MALYCSKVLGKRPAALRVMKRIKIMEEELVSGLIHVIFLISGLLSRASRHSCVYFLSISCGGLNLMDIVVVTHTTTTTQASAAGAEEGGGEEQQA